MIYPRLLVRRTARLFTLPVIVALMSCPLAAQVPVVLELHGAFQVEEVQQTSFLTPTGSGVLILPDGTGATLHAFHPQFELPSHYDRYNRRLNPMVVDAATALSRDGDRIEGAVRATQTLEYSADRRTTYGLEVEISLERAVDGTWRGHWSRADGQIGTATGFDDPQPADATPQFVMHFSTPGTFSSNGKGNPSDSGQVVARFEEGVLMEASVNGAIGRYTSYGNNSAWPHPVASADGRLLLGLGTSDVTGFGAEVTAFSGTADDGVYSVTMDFTSFRVNSALVPSNHVANTLTLTWGGVGRQAWGEGMLNGQLVYAYGHRVDPSRPGMPREVTLPPLPEDTINAIAQRMPYAVAVLADHPANNRLQSFTYPSAMMQEGGGGKQYDHEPMNGFGGVATFLMATRLRGETQDYAAAIRAAQWLVQKRKGTGLTSYYKTGFWWSAWQGMAFLDLYEATGHNYWLDRALEYAEVVRSKQQRSGTWTFVDADTGSIGNVFERNGTPYAGRPSNHGEQLLFLGRLRSMGVESFADVEEAAVAWHRQAVIDGTFHWHTRRSSYPYGSPEVKGNEALVEAFPILTYLYYLMKYRDDTTPAEVAHLVDFVEGHALVTSGTFSPALIGYEPRHTTADSHVPATYTTAQMAVIDLLRALRFGDEAAGERAPLFLRAILQLQEPDTGLIDHTGRNLPGHDLGAQNRLLSEQHQYMMLRAYTLQLMEEAAGLLEELSLPRAPSFTLHPADAQGILGEPLVLSVAVTGNPAPALQWFKEGVPIPDADGTTLVIPVVETATAGSYRVEAVNSEGSAVSTIATVTTVSPTPPTIITPPQSLSAPEFTNAVFAVQAEGLPAPAFQWFKVGEGALSDGPGRQGSTTATLTLVGVRPADAASYYVVATNSLDSVASAHAELTVIDAVPPSDATPPTDAIAIEGGSATFSVVADGSGPITYRWYFNGYPVFDGAKYQGAQSDTLTISNITASDAGAYQVELTNLVGSVMSRTAQLRINLPPQITLVRPALPFARAPAGTGLWLDAIVTDDGVGGGTLQLDWTMPEGPVEAEFTDPEFHATGVFFGAAGTYRLQLSASDGTHATTLDFPVEYAAEGLPPEVDRIFWGTTHNITFMEDFRNSTTRVAGLDLGLGDPVVNEGISFLTLRSIQFPLSDGSGADNPARNQLWAFSAISTDATSPTTPGINGIRWLGPDRSLNFNASHIAFLMAVENPHLRGTDGAPLDLTGAASASIELIQNDGGGEVRWAVRQDGQWYASSVFRSGPGTFATEGFDAVDWAPFDPQSLAGTTEGAFALWVRDLAFAPLTLDQVDAFGIISNSYSATNASRNLRLNSLVLSTSADPNIGPAIALNVPEFADAGVPVAVTATVTDDGLPEDPGTVSVYWSASDPAAAWSARETAAATVTFAGGGDHSLWLWADDGAITTFAKALIFVEFDEPPPAFDAWIAQFTDLLAARRGFFFDHSGDGLANGIAFAFGLDPRQMNAGHLPALGRMDGIGAEVGQTFLFLTYRQRIGATGNAGNGFVVDGLTYLPEFSATLGEDAWQSGPHLIEEVGPRTNNGDGTETVTLRLRTPVDPASPQFLRLRVESAP